MPLESLLGIFFPYLKSSVVSHCIGDIFLIINQVNNTHTAHAGGVSLTLAVTSKTALAIRLFTIP